MPLAVSTLDPMPQRTEERDAERAARIRTLKLRWWVAENFRRACEEPVNPDESPVDELGATIALRVHDWKIRRWMHEGIAPHQKRLEDVVAWMGRRLLEAPPGEELPEGLAALPKKRRR